MTWPGTVASATAGSVGAAADFNNHRDALNTLGGAWSTYAPALTASTTDPTQGASTYSGRCRLLGKTADIKIMFTLGAGFAAGSGTYRFGLPSGVVPLAVSSGEAMGVGNFFDVSTGATYAFNVYLFGASAVGLVNASGVASSTVPVVPANGDRISILIPALELV